MSSIQKRTLNFFDMPILNEQEARKLVEKALSFSKADETSVNVNGGRTGNIRYARNTVSTSGEKDNLVLTVTCSFGKRSGSASTNEINDGSIEKTVRLAEEIARLAPENPEYMPVLGPQTYGITGTFNAGLAAINASSRADIALESIKTCKEKNAVAAGYLEDNNSFTAIGNSKGLFGYNRDTVIDFTITTRTADDKGSGFAWRTYNDLVSLKAREATSIAIQKAKASAETKEMPPGKYTVILEPAAMNELLGSFMGALDARNAEEGRSFFSKKGGGTKLGEQLFSEKLTIHSDPFDDDIPGAPFANDGRPQERVVWVEKGVLKNFYYSRYWADKKGVKAIPPNQSVIINDGDQTLEQLIKGTEKGILITHMFYVRSVDAQNILSTGLTRDGLFYIENGVIKNAIKNFRWNESPVNVFRNLEALGKGVRVGNSIIPAIKARDFNFASLSDAV
jgi:predicted Zn-dependent protease